MARCSHHYSAKLRPVAPCFLVLPRPLFCRRNDMRGHAVLRKNTLVPQTAGGRIIKRPGSAPNHVLGLGQRGALRRQKDAAAMNDLRRPDDLNPAHPTSNIQSSTDSSNPTAGLLSFDPADYREHLDSCPITDAEKDELLRALWGIMCAFVDLGWGLDAVSLVFQNTQNSPSEAAPQAGQSESERGAAR